MLRSKSAILRRIVLALSICAASFTAVGNTNCLAEHFDDSDDLCGWATHDSCPIQTPIARNTRTTTSFAESIATAASVATASLGVSLEQFTEPLSMISPNINNTLDSLDEINQMLQEASQQAQENAAEPTETTETDTVVDEITSNGEIAPEIVSFVPVVDFDDIIKERPQWANNLDSATTSDLIPNDKVFDTDPIAEDDHCAYEHLNANEQATEDLAKNLSTNEPAKVAEETDPNVGSFGQSILMDSDFNEGEKPAAVDNDDVEPSQDFVATSRTFVGSSAVVFSIDEAYMPYDIAVRDLESDWWSPLKRRPFCIRARNELPEFEFPLEQEVISLVGEPVVQSEIEEIKANRLLDKWVQTANDTLAKRRTIRKWLQPENVGRQVSSLVVTRKQMVTRLADRLVSAWPIEPSASVTGAKLLARAHAIENDQSDADQITRETESLAIATAAVSELVGKVRSAFKSLGKDVLQIAGIPREDAASNTSHR